MLVLSRKDTEQILIGDHVVVTVLEIRGNQVRLGVNAPPEVRVLRSELQAIRRREAPVLIEGNGTGTIPQEGSGSVAI